MTVPPGALSSRMTTALAIGAFCSALYGFKLWVIAAIGNATPFWDQWDAELSYLFLPYKQGSLDWLPFVVPHAEHRILTTRLLNFGLFLVNGLWNPLLEMVVNAGLHVIALMLTAVWMARAAGRQYLPAILLFTLVMFGLPFGWQNTLAGFQAQFYFLVLFSVAALWLVATAQPFGLRWLAGILCALLAYFSLASGVIAVAALALVTLVDAVTTPKIDRRRVAAGGLLVVLSIAGYVWTPVWPGHEPLKASSIAQLYRGLVAVLSWPVPSHLAAAVARNLPAAAFLVFFLYRRPPARDAAWFLFSLVVWTTGQAFVLAYGRSGVLESRYLDIVAMGLLVNVGCLVWLLGQRLPAVASARAGESRVVQMLSAAWVLGVALTIGGAAAAKLEGELAFKKEAGIAEETNARNFMLTGDMVHLKDKPFMMIPFPDAERMAAWLNDPAVRSILPANLQMPLTPTVIDSQPPGVFVADGFYPSTPKRAGVTLGSYSAAGDAAVGRGSLRFAPLALDGSIAFPVAGYPARPRMELFVEQDGQTRPVTLVTNPAESWQMATASVTPGPFTIRITDMNPNTWVAVGAPTVSGRLDWIANALLSGYYVFLVFGAALAMLALLLVQRDQRGGVEAWREGGVK